MVNKGWYQLVEYRNRRSQEMEQKIGKREDCFHDRLDTLDAVRHSHDDIIASHRADDPITSNVVKTLTCDMLLFEEGQRPAAHFLYGKLRRVIKSAKAEIRDTGAPLGPTNTKSPLLKDPPKFPPNHKRHKSGESVLVQRPYAGPKVWVPERSLSPIDTGREFSGSRRASRQSPMHPEKSKRTQHELNTPNITTLTHKSVLHTTRSTLPAAALNPDQVTNGIQTHHLRGIIGNSW